MLGSSACEGRGIPLHPSSNWNKVKSQTTNEPRSNPPAGEDSMANDEIPRRHFLVGAGAAAAALAPTAVPAPAEAQQKSQTPAGASGPEGYFTLTAPEAAFFSA